MAEQGVGVIRNRAPPAKPLSASARWETPMSRPSGVVTMAVLRSRFASRSMSSRAFAFGLTVLGPPSITLSAAALGRPRQARFGGPSEDDAVLGRHQAEALSLIALCS